MARWGLGDRGDLSESGPNLVHDFAPPDVLNRQISTAAAHGCTAADGCKPSFGGMPRMILAAGKPEATRSSIPRLVNQRRPIDCQNQERRVRDVGESRNMPWQSEMIELRLHLLAAHLPRAMTLVEHRVPKPCSLAFASLHEVRQPKDELRGALRLAPLKADAGIRVQEDAATWFHMPPD